MYPLNEITKVKETLSEQSLKQRIQVSPFNVFQEIPLLFVRKDCIRYLEQQFDRREALVPKYSSWFEKTIDGLAKNPFEELLIEVISLYLFMRSRDLALEVRAVEFVLDSSERNLTISRSLSKLICSKVVQNPALYKASRKVRVFLFDELDRWVRYKGDELEENEDICLKRTIKAMLVAGEPTLLEHLGWVQSNLHLSEVVDAALKWNSWTTFAKVTGLVNATVRKLQAEIKAPNGE